MKIGSIVGIMTAEKKHQNQQDFDNEEEHSPEKIFLNLEE